MSDNHDDYRRKFEKWVLSCKCFSGQLFIYKCSDWKLRGVKIKKMSNIEFLLDLSTREIEAFVKQQKIVIKDQDELFLIRNYPATLKVMVEAGWYLGQPAQRYIITHKLEGWIQALDNGPLMPTEEILILLRWPEKAGKIFQSQECIWKETLTIYNLLRQQGKIEDLALEEKAIMDL